MTDLEELTQALLQFRDERDWAQFHDSKNLATAIGIEAAELAVEELFPFGGGDLAVLVLVHGVQRSFGMFPDG